jgi:S1-C subfamily serine protease
MQYGIRRLGWAVMLAIGGLLTSAPGPAVGAEAKDYERLLAEKSPALVTVKFLLKVSMGGAFAGGGNQESETEVTGVMMDPKGLVLCSNTQLGGFAGMMRRMMGSRGGDITATPTDIKVLIGDDTEGVEAKILGRDSELDLAWIQIDKPAKEAYAHVDFSKAAKPKVGEALFTIRRLSKFFDRSTVIEEGRVGGTTSKPRELYVPVPANSLQLGLGLPCYVTNGQVIGVAVVQVAETDGSEAGMMAMMSSMQDTMSGFLLPAETVLKATARAKGAADENENEGEEKTLEDEKGEDDEDEEK